MPIRAVLFDHDDTLIPTLPLRGRTWGRAVRELLGLDIDGAEYLCAHPGEPIEHSALRLTHGDATLAARLVVLYREYYFGSDAALSPYPGVAETVTALRGRGIRTAVVTSKIHAGAEGELRRAGLAGLFDCLIGSDDVSAHKPHPEPVLAAVARVGVTPAEALMIGDTAADLLAARAAGARSVAALWGATDAPALLALDPDHALVDVREVLGLVDT